MTRGPVLVGFDFTEGAEIALQQAHLLAKSARKRLIVGHVLPEAFNTRVLFPHQAGVDSATQERIEQIALEAITARLSKTLGAVPDIALETGSPHAGLLALADRVKAGLIVVGPGTVAMQTARAATRPVLISRVSPDRGAVLGATDFSDPSLPAVRAAGREAARRHARLRLLHCLDVDPPVHLATEAAFLSYPQLSDDAYAALERDTRTRLDTALADAGLDGDTLVVRGPAVEGIVDTARATPTALVVVGSRGRSGLIRFALGSVAERVVSRAPCSVLVVPLSDNEDTEPSGDEDH